MVKNKSSVKRIKREKIDKAPVKKDNKGEAIELADVLPIIVAEEKLEEEITEINEEDEEDEDLTLDEEEINPFGDKWEQ